MSRRGASAALAAAGLLVVVRLWAMPAAASLWLDEFGTVWVTDGGLSRVVERARLFPQSIPYGALVALVRGAVGSSEIALRWPSLAAMLAAAYLVGRLGRACFGPGAGLLAAGTFLLFPSVEFAAGDARPYAFAVLGATAALLFLRAWLEKGRARDAAGYVLASSAAVYFQYLFAGALAGHALYAAFRLRRGAPVSRRAAAAVAGSLAAMLVPAAALVGEIGASRQAHSFGAAPGALALVNALLPVRVLGLLLPAVVVAALLGGMRIPRRPAADARDLDPAVLLFSAAWAPPAILFAVSLAAATPVFEGRYLLETAPAWAVLLGAGLARIAPPVPARLALAGALGLAFVIRGEPSRLGIPHGREDWRDAVAAALREAPGAPILLAGSFAEAGDPARATDPRHQEYLVEPVRYYAPGASVSALPLGAARSPDAVGESLAAAAVAAPRFVLVERASRWPSRAEWLDRLAAPRGFHAREVWGNGPIRVRLYERSAAAD